MDPSFEALSQALGRLPGFGRRSAERAALALVADREKLDALRAALGAVAEDVRLCALCGSVTSVRRNPCALCTDPKRDPAVLCVVEEPGDILALERAGAFNGRYHALLGRLSAARATGPAELRLRELAERVASEGVREIVLALGTDMEGDATAAYIAEMFRDTAVAVTRLAFGLPAGSGVRFSDPVTLGNALRGRQNV